MTDGGSIAPQTCPVIGPLSKIQAEGWCVPRLLMDPEVICSTMPGHLPSIGTLGSLHGDTPQLEIPSRPSEERKTNKHGKPHWQIVIWATCTRTVSCIKVHLSGGWRCCGTWAGTPRSRERPMSSSIGLSWGHDPQTGRSTKLALFWMPFFGNVRSRNLQSITVASERLRQNWEMEFFLSVVAGRPDGTI